MSYETIILELLTRIKKLEDEVKELKQVISSPVSQALSTEESDNSFRQKIDDGLPSRTKMTEEMMEACYENGKKLSLGENVVKLADDIALSTGMNRNSAIMYLYAVHGMLNGTIYKRAISAKAMKKYYDAILDEKGREGLAKAIKATRLHIKYRRECGQQVDSIEEICQQYESRLS